MDPHPNASAVLDVPSAALYCSGMNCSTSRRLLMCVAAWSCSACDHPAKYQDVVLGMSLDKFKSYNNAESLPAVSAEGMSLRPFQASRSDRKETFYFRNNKLALIVAEFAGGISFDDALGEAENLNGKARVQSAMGSKIARWGKKQMLIKPSGPTKVDIPLLGTSLSTQNVVLIALLP